MRAIPESEDKIRRAYELITQRKEELEGTDDDTGELYGMLDEIDLRIRNYFRLDEAPESLDTSVDEMKLDKGLVAKVRGMGKTTLRQLTDNTGKEWYTSDEHGESKLSQHEADQLYTTIGNLVLYQDLSIETWNPELPAKFEAQRLRTFNDLCGFGESSCATHFGRPNVDHIIGKLEKYGLDFFLPF